METDAEVWITGVVETDAEVWVFGVVETDAEVWITRVVETDNWRQSALVLSFITFTLFRVLTDY